MNDEAAAEFGRLLREHRLAAGLTQEALAERAGAGVRSIQALERGESKPLRDTVRRLTVALGLPPEERIRFTAAAEPAPRRRPPAMPERDEPLPDRLPIQAPSPPRAGHRAALPVPLTSFVGRDREMAEIARLLERSRLLTLTGPGGTGKTRLALQLAATVHAHFAGGAVFVPLATILDPSLVAVTIATGLGVQQGDEPSLAHALIARLRTQQLLLVLDNFEQVAEAAPLVAELLAGCPALTVLVTSRMPLHLSGEQEYAVPPLSVSSDEQPAGTECPEQSPAVSLFVQRAQLVRPGFALTPENAPVVHEICRRLDGLPLAIELAAARLKLLAPVDLLGRLGQRLQVLTGGPQDLSHHQRTLRGTMDWSYDLMHAEEQMLFRRLAVFAGGWTLDAAEAICGDDLEGGVLDILGSLLDKSLLLLDAGATGETRYAMLETVRAYALDRLVAGGEAEELQRRHACYFGELAGWAAPDPGRKVAPDRLDWSEREEDNLRAARDWAHDHHEVVLEMRLMVPLIGCWYSRRQLREAQGHLERLHGLRDRNRDRVPPDLLIRALSALAGILWKDGEYERAAALMEECLAYCRAPGLSPYIGPSLQLLAHVTCEKGDYTKAAAHYQESLAIAREADDTVGAARALLGLGDVARGLGDAAGLIAACEEGLPLTRETADREFEGFALQNLGIAALLQRDFARADALLTSSLALFRELGYPTDIAEALTNVGRVASAQGQLERARAAFVESLSLAQSSGPFFIIPDAIEGLAGLAIVQGRAEHAARLFGAAQALRHAKGMLPEAMRWARNDHDMAAARAVLGDTAFEAAYRAGQALRLEDAIALALEASAELASPR